MIFLTAEAQEITEVYWLCRTYHPITLSPYHPLTLSLLHRITPLTISSTTAGSSNVVVSPSELTSPSATFRKMRRMIFPERVFGILYS